MTYVMCLSLAMMGGHKWRQPYNPCYSPAPVVYSVPCWQPVIVCQPTEQAEPVADLEEDAEGVSIESEIAELLAALDRPESLTPEIGLAELADVVAMPGVATPGLSGGGTAMGFTPGLGGVGGGVPGLGFGSGQGRPGVGIGGFAGGSGGGSGAGEAEAEAPEQDQLQALVVNVNSMLNNVNNLSQSQQQQQEQKQKQKQNQRQRQGRDGKPGHGKPGRCEEIPLPATAWMGLFGMAAIVFAKRRNML